MLKYVINRLMHAFFHFSPLADIGTDNTMAKRKKGQTKIYKTLHRKLKINDRIPLKTEVISVFLVSDCK
jgi:hypothetical protein